MLNFFDKLSVAASKAEKQPPMAMSAQDKEINLEIDAQIKGGLMSPNLAKLRKKYL
jgi:hypothetical protein